MMDTLIHVPYYPKEDTKLKAIRSKPAGGGPVATGLVTAAKLGEDVEYIGVLADDASGRFLMEDFENYAVGTEHVQIEAGHRSFCSTIWLSEQAASRTCVFDKGDLPPLVLEEKQKKLLGQIKLLMVDGNELEAAAEAAEIVRKHGGKVLYDCGGLYPNVDKLLVRTDIMIPSEEFALEYTGAKSAEDAAKRLYEKYHPEIVVITQGKHGGIFFDGKTFGSYPSYPAKVVDSNGAGDVFHGAFAAAVMKGFGYEVCCHIASAVSAIKCMGIGARESIPDFETVKHYLKENGYEL